MTLCERKYLHLGEINIERQTIAEENNKTPRTSVDKTHTRNKETKKRRAGNADIKQTIYTKKTRQNVYNISKKELTNDQNLLLEKGLHFVPTRGKINIAKLLERRMRLREYFDENEETREGIDNPMTTTYRNYTIRLMQGKGTKYSCHQVDETSIWTYTLKS